MNDIEKLTQYVANNDDIAIEAAGIILGLIRRVRRQDICIDEQENNQQRIYNERDLYRRRTDLARSILCDDENGLTTERLQQIADLIYHGWTSPISIPPTNPPIPTDPTQVPTGSGPNGMTASESEMMMYLRMARGLFSLLEPIEGLVLGPLFEKGLKDFTEGFSRLAAKFPQQID